MMQQPVQCVQSCSGREQKIIQRAPVFVFVLLLHVFFHLVLVLVASVVCSLLSQSAVRLSLQCHYQMHDKMIARDWGKSNETKLAGVVALHSRIYAGNGICCGLIPFQLVQSLISPSLSVVFLFCFFIRLFNFFKIRWFVLRFVMGSLFSFLCANSLCSRLKDNFIVTHLYCISL